VSSVSVVCPLSVYVHCSLSLTLLVIPVCPLSVLCMRCQHNYVSCSLSLRHGLTHMMSMPLFCWIMLCVLCQYCLSTVSICPLFTFRHMLPYMQSVHPLYCLIPVCPLSMKDDRLSGLAMISTESDMTRRLDMTDVINTFATSKVRIKPF